MPASDGRPDRATLTLFALLVLMGGANVVAIRVINLELAPFWGAGLRLSVAAALMFAIVALRKYPLPRGRALVGMTWFIILNFASISLFSWGTVRVPAGLASVILAAAPLVTFGLAVTHRQEGFRWRGLVGATLALAGMAFVLAGPMSGSVSPVSLLAVAGSVLASAESAIVLKGLPHTHPAPTAAIAIAAAAALALGLSLATGEHLARPEATRTWLALGYMVLLGAPVLFVLYIAVLRRWTAPAVSYQSVLTPPIVIALGALVADEKITSGLLLGGPLVLLGVYVGALSHPRAQPAPGPS